MAITLTVEDGTGIADANTYVDLDYANTYLTNRGRSEWTALDEEVKKQCLILGTDYIDKLYKWYGRRKFKSQVLAFPRVDLYDSDNFSVDGIPVNLKKAVCEAAYLNRSVETLFSTKDSDGTVKREKVDTLEVEYFENTKSTEIDYTSIYDVLNTLLFGLYKTDSDASTFNVGAIWSRDELL